MRTLFRLFSVCIFSTVIISCGGSAGNGSEQEPTSPITFNPKVTIDASLDVPEFFLTATSSKNSAIVDENISFAVVTSGNQNSISDVTWRFDDGTSLQGITVNKSFSQPGVYEASVLVTDSAGVQEITSLVVNISITASVTVPQFLGARYGDIDGNGSIDSTDVSIIENHLNATQLILDDNARIAADLDLDDQITENDRDLMNQVITSGWPTYISKTSGIPGNTVLIMLPELLNLQNNIEIRLSSGETIVPSRLIPGYASFMLPIDEISFTSGVFTDKDINIGIYVNDSLATSFSFHVDSPGNFDQNAGTILMQNIESIDESLLVVRANVESLLVDANATPEERDAILHVLSVAEAEMLEAKNDYLAILSSFDETTLAFIANLSQSVPDNSAINSNKISPLYSKSKLSSNLFLSSKSSLKTWPAGCSVSDRLDRLLRSTDTRVANEMLFAPVAQAFQDSCSVITAASLIFPPMAAIAIPCLASSTKIITAQTLLEVILEVIPKMGGDLLLTATPDSLSVNETAYIKITAIEESKLCEVTTNQVDEQINKIIIDKVIKKFTKRLRIGMALEAIKKIPLIDKKLYRQNLVSTVNKVTDDIINGVQSSVDSEVSNVRKKFCALFDSDTPIEIPACALDQFSTNSNLATAGILNKDLGTYQVPTYEDCKEGEVTISAALTSGDGFYAGHGSTKVTQTCPISHIGAWTAGGSTLVFLNNTSYIIAHTNNNELEAYTSTTYDSELDSYEEFYSVIPVAAEYGGYTWNSVTGSLSVAVSGESDGLNGFSYAQGSMTMTVNNNNLTILDAAGSTTLTRVVSDTSNIGAWTAGGSTLVFLNNTSYIIAHTNNNELEAYTSTTYDSELDSYEEFYSVIPVAAEYGGYTWNSVTGSLSVAVSDDSDGQGGFSYARGSMTMTVNNNNLTIIDAAGSTTLTRVP